jgi:hypothetical protein
MRTRRIVALAVMAFFISTTAFGYWTAPGSGAGAGAVLDFSTPTLTVTNPNPSTAHLAWTAANVLPVGSGPDYEVTYLVDRRPNGSGAWTSVCGTGTTPLGAATLSCDNNNIAVTNDYDFRVTARFRSWSATVVSTAHIVADTTAPIVTLTSPAAGSFLTNATPTLSGAAGTALGDQSTITVDICPGASAGCGSPLTLTTTASGGSWSLTPGSALVDGVHTARARQSDAVGNVGQSAARTFVIDTQDPTATMTGPADGANVRASISLTATATDPLKNGVASGVASVQFERSPAGAGTWSNTGAADPSSPYVTTLDTTTLTDGQYDIRAAATDQAGNVKRSAKITVRVDNTLPTGSITAPAANAYVSGTVTVTSNSADAGSGVASAQFQRSPAGANTWTNLGAADTTSPYSASMPTAALGEGSYDLRVITTDTVGNAAFTSPVVTVRVDKTAPSGVAITAPGAGSTVRGTVAMTATATDPTSGGVSSGIASVLFQRSPQGAGTWTDIVSDTASPYTGSWDTTTLVNGTYDLRAVATDTAGNVTNSATRTVTVANGYPTALTLANFFGTVGTADNADTIRVTFSEALDLNTICSGWDGSLQTPSAMDAVITDNGVNDILTISYSGCAGGTAFNFGSLALGADYVTATTAFGGNGIGSATRYQWNGGSNQLTIYIGVPRVAGTTNANVPAAPVTYTPSPALRTALGWALLPGPFGFGATRF